MGRAWLSDTEIYKNTYHDLVLKYKDLLWQLEWWKSIDNNSNYRKYLEGKDQLLLERERRISLRELDLAEKERYIGIMKTFLEKAEETVLEEIASEENIVDLEEVRKYRRKAGGYSGNSDDWLTPMPWGTQFYVRPKVQKTWMLAKFLKAGNSKRIIYLVPMQGSEDFVEDNRQWLPVEAVAFCKYFELVEQFTERDNE